MPTEAGRWLYIATIFASAFCIFLVQPMVGKRILPWFGGTPAVWTLCLAFYQSALLMGYVYAHVLIRYARPSRQLIVHTAFVGAALIALPVLPGDAWKPHGAAPPTVPILIMLLANVALPFVLLASTGPLVQAWFSRRYPSRSPYPLYAVSNIGSVLALIAYPLWFEPRFSLSETGTFWSIAFATTLAAVLGCAAMARFPVSDPAVSQAATEDAQRAEPGSIAVALWLLLSGAAVVMLMGITNKLCLDVASVPFLWILPLLAYLLTFIICFASERTYRREPYLLLFLMSLLLSAGSDLWIPSLDPAGQLLAGSVYVQVPSYCALLFASCMIMHGELYRLRPPASALTAFYLYVSLGGACGGIFVGVMAPLLFTDYFEFDLGLVLVVALSLAARANDRASVFSFGASRWRWIVVSTFTIGVTGIVVWQDFRVDPQLRSQQRGFFGVVRVSQRDSAEGSLRLLTHGSTVHGMQYLDDSRRRLATSYYGAATAVGMALNIREPGESTRIGVIGLGVGTLAAYGRTGDLMRFYEIDPAIIEVARDSGDFSYLKDSAAEIEVVLGDARISLSEERGEGISQNYDMLIVDAFNSDAVPVHLMTREMFRHYKAAIGPRGLLAFHLSNRHFDLMTLISRMAIEVGLESIQVRTLAVPDRQSLHAKWVLIARNREQINRLERKLKRHHRELGIASNLIHTRFMRRIDVAHAPVWIDDYSDLYSILERRW